MKTRFLPLAGALLAFFSLNTLATTRYVDINCAHPISSYTTWETAATNIQDAIDVSASGDLILVTNGIYQSGSRANSGLNRVNIYKAVIVQSVNGPAVTVIKGAWDTATNGPNAVRCVYLASGATLSGFTLTNGATPSGEYGGGVRCISTNAAVTNCVITGNSAYSLGGGAYYGTLVNCLLSGNVVAPFSSTGSGGGAAYSVLINCLLTGNFVGYTGGAAAYCTIVNCTVVSNASAAYDGSLLGGMTKNSIVYYNFNYYTNAETGSGLVFSNCCLSFPVSASSGANNFTNPPMFANLAGGDYHLNPGSPCINAGSNSAITNQVDLDGNPRIVGGIVDLGAYEFQSPVKYVSIANPSPVAPFTNWTTAATRIQDAVDAANAGDCIVVSNGVYTTGGRVVFGAMGNCVVLTNAVTLTSVNGPQFTSIVGGSQTRGVFVGSNAVVSGFTITNGQTQYGNGDRTNDESGGGIWSQTGGVVSNCFIVGNTAWSDGGCGGGIYGGSIFNSTLTNNTAANGGGAAFASAFNCLFASNSAPYSPPFGYGGGIYHGTASNCTFVANGWGYGVSGGAAYQSRLFNCTLNTNFATYGGGGAQSSILYNCKLTGNRSSFAGGCYQSTNYNCLFVNNSASGGGGGVYGGISFSCIFTNNTASNYGGAADNGTLYNCLLTANASGLGGGAYHSSLFNCTVAGNTATSAGGGIIGGGASNCIVYFNSAPDGTNFGGGGSLIFCDTTPLANGSGNITNDPVFVSLAGGDFHLQTNSPCINSGNNSYVTTSTDLAGNPRIVGGTVDIGAYEFQSPQSHHFLCLVATIRPARRRLGGFCVFQRQRFQQLAGMARWHESA